jgi:hypothetical protein
MFWIRNYLNIVGGLWFQKPRSDFETIPGITLNINPIAAIYHKDQIDLKKFEICNDYLSQTFRI